MDIPITIFFNGPPGVGKTSVAQYLATTSKKGAVIDVDEIRHFQKGGICRDPFDQAFVDQKRLAYINTKCLITNFRKQALETFVSDLALDQRIIDAYQDELANLENSYHFVLLPNISVAKERNKLRNEWAVMEDDVIEKYYGFVEKVNLPKEWIVIDTSHQTVEETADTILEKLKNKNNETN